jgi:superfamily II DNA/RNA helicase
MVDLDSAVTEAASLLGFDSLKDEQRHCMKSFLEGRDVFVILPTGFGKTACFTCLPYAFDILQNLLWQERQAKEALITASMSTSTPLSWHLLLK